MDFVSCRYNMVDSFSRGSEFQISIEHCKFGGRVVVGVS